MLEKLNIIFACLLITFVFDAILMILNIFQDTSITDWLSVLIYSATLYVAYSAFKTANQALQENKKIAEDTARMADDNAKLVKQQTQPFIDIRLDIMPQSVHWVRLKITNIGLSSAINIQFRFETLPNNNKEVTHKVIQNYKRIRFMTDGLNYLSKEESRYTNFINLIDSDEKRGFTVEEFLQTSFKVIVNFNDLSGFTYQNDFVLSMNELDGYYKIGDTNEEKLINELKNVNTNIKNLRSICSNFTAEYEKAHRDWTESELKQKIREIETRKTQYKWLGKEYPKDIVIPKKKLSIQQLRKQNK